MESRTYGHRGRPRKDEEPSVRVEYRVDVSLEFDEEKARELSKDRSVRVLITNLPRANEDAENIRYRMTEEGEYELDDDGGKIEAARSVWYSPEWRAHGVYAMTREQAEKYRELIASVRAVEDENENRTEALASLADPFFAGREGLEETVKQMMAAA